MNKYNKKLDVIAKNVSLSNEEKLEALKSLLTQVESTIEKYGSYKNLTSYRIGDMIETSGIGATAAGVLMMFVTEIMELCGQVTDLDEAFTLSTLIGTSILVSGMATKGISKRIKSKKYNSASEALQDVKDYIEQLETENVKTMG